MRKKKDLPAMPFYIGDWKKDPGVRALSKEEKYIWLEMLFLMWESEDRGYLSFNGKPIPDFMLAQMLDISEEKLKKIKEKFEFLNLYSKDKKGRIYSRKILKIVELSKIRSLAGKSKGQQNGKQKPSKNGANAPANSENENENENENESENLKKKIPPVFFEVAEHLKTRVLQIKQQKITEKTMVTWAKCAQKMNKLDKRTIGDIHKLIDECHDMEPNAGGFTWRNNILSMQKLRERWNEGKIWLGMNKRKETPDERTARILGLDKK